MRALLLNSGRTAYGAVRRLRPACSEIVVVDHAPSPLERSRWVDRHLTLPSPSSPDTSPADLISRLIDIRGDGPPMVLFCCKDDWVELVSYGSRELAPHFRFTSETDPERLAAVLDKRRLLDSASRAGVPVPRSAVELTDIPALAAPIIVKPARKHRLGRDVQADAFRLAVCDDHGTAIARAQQVLATGSPFVAQEVIGGDPPILHTAAVVAARGRLLAVGTARKVRQFPARFGECAVGETTHEPEVERAAELLVRATGLNGVAQIEFIEQDGRLVLLEVNPRLWSWHEIHAPAGVDVATMAARSALDPVDSAPPLRQDPSARIRWTFGLMDLLHTVLLGDRSASTSIEFVRNLVNTDIEAFASLRDPMVTVRHTLRSVPFLVGELGAGRRDGWSGGGRAAP